MRRNLKEELIAVVRINDDFVIYIANACGKRRYVLTNTHVIVFCFYLISKGNDAQDDDDDDDYDDDDDDDDYGHAGHEYDDNATPEIR